VILRALLALALLIGAAAAQAEPALRVAVLKFGTVNWLTDAIRTHGYDRDQGFTLQTVELAGRDATTIAFQAGDADVIVADWLWAMLMRERGRDIRFIPYSRSVGALMAMPDGGVQGLCDLRGRTVGVVGGELDKSWLIFQALARRDCGFDLRSETRALFGAAPLMSRQLQTGAVDALSTYWHFAARAQAAGASRVLDVSAAMQALGVDPAPPLVGFVYDAGRTDPALAQALGRAALAAGRLMADSDGEWDRLRPLMQAEGEAEFAALRDAYRAGIVTAPWAQDDTAAAQALHATLMEAGGPAFAAEAGPFDAGAFAAAPR
jgi:NitT/TauT family transport system substrate-binding protein